MFFENSLTVSDEIMELCNYLNLFNLVKLPWPLTFDIDCCSYTLKLQLQLHTQIVDNNKYLFIGYNIKDM